MNEHHNHTPDWVKNAVFYQIFPDRFAWSNQVSKPGNFEKWDSPPTIDGFKGGDLMGVYEKLDYLEDLGINAIYFNPIFMSASNHRYHTFDYYRVDPLLGGNEAFFTLLDEAHKRQIRIVLDGVFNHASRGFFPFHHIMETGSSSPYYEWFNIKCLPLNAYHTRANYDCWWNLPALPKLNTKNPQVRKYIFDVARYWVEKGIDGWRLDVPFEIDEDEFWEEFRDVVKTANPDAYIVGEIPSEAQRWLGTGRQFDAVMNYQLTHIMLAFFGGHQIDRQLAEGMMGLPAPHPADAAQFAARTSRLLEMYPKEFSYAQMNLLDSHDMPRFLSLVQGDVRRLKLAYLFLMTYPGAPTIYYGDEIGLTGGRDPLNRKSFPWDKSHWNLDLRDYIRELISVRLSMPVLRRGSYEPVYTQERVLAYLRRDHHEDKVLVIINAEETPRTVSISLNGAFEDQSILQDQIGKASFTVDNNQLRDITIPAQSGYILT
ncbi:MAG: glycoside hydrolase family 13 protein [Anaerolineaceae bacterium]|nr:glycoside hydrolase family 13 protein [Anaerolineaceae bacterium]